MADALAKVENTQLARLELDQARARLAYAVRSLKGEALRLNVPLHVRTSINRHPWLWLGGAFAVGALLGRFTRRLP